MDPVTFEKAAEQIGRRLTPAMIRTALKDWHSSRRGKGVERIVAETENTGRLLRTRVDDGDLASFLLDVAGLDVLSIQSLRYCLALHASPGELDALHDFPGAARARGVTPESLARCVSERKWHPGKRWARHFVDVLGFPPELSGLPGSPKNPDFEDVQPHVKLPELEDFQTDLRNQVLDLLSSPPGQNRAVLTLPTGAGKTRTTVEALIDWWLRDREGDFIVWIAQSEELCEQAVQAFREVWIDRGDRGVRDTMRVYRFWGAGRIIPDESGADGVIVATIDKLDETLREGSPRRGELLRIVPGVRVIVVDEAHRAEAPSYRKVLEDFNVKFASQGRSAVAVLGLTATPLRSQQRETIQLARRFYNRLLRPQNLPADPEELVSALRSRQVLSYPTHRLLPTGRPICLTQKQEEYLQSWNEFPPELLTQLGEERNRNRLLLECVSALDPSWPILFFGCTVQHAEAMAVLLRRRGISAAVITADTREATRRQLVQAFKAGEIRVLCNYGVLTTGFDAPKVRAVVVSRPTTSRVLYDQMIGRGMRGARFGGTQDCLVVDVDDNLIHFGGGRLATAATQYDEYWSNRS
jgi:DNA repair protein RadD